MVTTDLAAVLEAGGRLDFSHDPDRSVLCCPPGAEAVARRLADEEGRAELRRVLTRAAAYRRALLGDAREDAETLARDFEPAVRAAVETDALRTRTRLDALFRIASPDARAISSSGNSRPNASAGPSASAGGARRCSSAPNLAARVTAFRRQLHAWCAAGRPGWPLFVLPDAPLAPPLACVSCSGPIPPPAPAEVVARVRCAVCVEAIRLAVEGEPGT